MKPNEKKKRRLMIYVLSLAVVFLMVSTVSAIPYVQGDGIRKLDDYQAKLERVLESRPYKHLKALVEPWYNTTYNESVRAYIREQIEKNVSAVLPKSDGPMCPALVAFLNSMAEAVIYLFGHNAFGYIMAIGTVEVLALLMSIVIGTMEAPVAILAGFAAIIGAISSFLSQIVYQAGIIGAVLVFICLLPVALGLLILSIPVSIAGYAVAVFMDTIKYVVIPGGGNQTPPPPGQNHPPYTPSLIRPADGGLVKDCTADLTWLASDPDIGDTVLVDVWFGPDPGRMYLIQQNTTLKSTPTPGLQSYTNYTWQVVAWDNHGAETKGPVWHFHTGNLASSEALCENGNG